MRNKFLKSGKKSFIQNWVIFHFCSCLLGLKCKSWQMFNVFKESEENGRNPRGELDKH